MIYYFGYDPGSRDVFFFLSLKQLALCINEVYQHSGESERPWVKFALTCSFPQLTLDTQLYSSEISTAVYLNVHIRNKGEGF